jgi:preflagellin peptidase FlaK
MTVVGGVATGPDLLRLLAVPTFAWAAYSDLRTRRVSNRTWLPLALAGLLALAWEAWAILASPTPPFLRRAFLLRTALSLGVVAPLGYLFWRVGGFGGADAKALGTLAVAVPAVPVYYLPWAALPLTASRLGVFSLTVLTNTVLVGAAYPLALAAANARRGERSLRGFVGKPVDSDRVVLAYGRLLDPDPGLGRGGLDLDALRMYLRWRGASLASLRADADAHRDPASVGATHDPGDGTVGSLSTDGGDPASGVVGGERRGASPSSADRVAPDDAWAASAFLECVDGDAYGTTPTELREGLETLVEREVVWVTPGLPFVVPMFVGLVTALVVGDLLSLSLGLLGLV